MGIVKVRQTQGMGKLVADDANPGGSLPLGASQFRGAAVGIQQNAVQGGLPKGSILRQGEIPLMGPDGLCWSTLGLVVSGIDIHNLVQDAVAVHVIDREVHFLIQLETGLIQGQFRGGVGTDAVGKQDIPAVISPVFVQGDGAQHVKDGLIDAQGVVQEVVPDRPGTVQEAVHAGGRVLQRKRNVAELDEHARHPHLALGHGRPMPGTGQPAAGRLLLRLQREPRYEKERPAYE